MSSSGELVGMVRAGPLCGVCDRIVGRPPVAATVRWWTHEGRYHIDLCPSCLAEWLRGAADDPEMQPYRKERLPATARWGLGTTR